MNKIAAMKALKEQQEAIERQIADIEKDCSLIEEIVDFVRTTIEGSGLSMMEVALALEPKLDSKVATSGAVPKQRTRKARKTKTYLNPLTSESI